jgi:glycosyltransferase involved in cell wall biosynthesis
VRRRLGGESESGAQAWVDALASALSRRDDVAVSIASPSLEPYEPFTADGVEYLAVRGRRPQSRLCRVAEGWAHRDTAWPILQDAWDLVRRVRPDLVHIHGTENPFGLLAPLIQPLPCVISLQGLMQACAREYFAGQPAEAVLRLLASPEFLKGRGEIHGYVDFRQRARREVEIMRGARWFMGRTAWDHGVLRATNPKGQYFHCDEIVRPPFYEAEWTDDAPDDFVYSTSSSMLFKGTATLLEAAAVLERWGRRTIRLRVAGVPPGSEVDALLRRAASHWRVEERVEWLGRLGAKEIVKELCSARAFVYTSHADNSPNAVVEAMLAGAPIAAPWVGGIPSLVANGEEGLLYSPGDAVALAECLERLLGDRALAAQVGAGARRRARARNDAAEVSARTVAIYREVLARSTGAGGARLDDRRKEDSA